MLGIYACAHEDFPVMRFRYFVADREPHSQTEACKLRSLGRSVFKAVRMKIVQIKIYISERVVS